MKCLICCCLPSEHLTIYWTEQRIVMVVPEYYTTPTLLQSLTLNLEVVDGRGRGYGQPRSLDVVASLSCSRSPSFTAAVTHSEGMLFCELRGCNLLTGTSWLYIGCIETPKDTEKFNLTRDTWHAPYCYFGTYRLQFCDRNRK